MNNEGGVITAATSDAIDEWRVREATVIHNMAKIKATLMEIGNKIPMYVATALPPLNSSQMEKQWPRKAPRAAISAMSTP